MGSCSFFSGPPCFDQISLSCFSFSLDHLDQVNRHVHKGYYTHNNRPPYRDGQPPGCAQGILPPPDGMCWRTAAMTYVLPVPASQPAVLLCIQKCVARGGIHDPAGPHAPGACTHPWVGTSDNGQPAAQQRRPALPAPCCTWRCRQSLQCSGGNSGSGVQGPADRSAGGSALGESVALCTALEWKRLCTAGPLLMCATPPPACVRQPSCEPPPPTPPHTIWH
jgi:hypothetical protein